MNKLEEQDSHHNFHISIGSSLEEVEGAVSTALAYIEGEIPEHALFASELTLREALVNAIKHGNRFNQDKSVHLEIHIDQKTLFFKIQDEGNGFNWREEMAKTFPAHDQDHGRGLVLIREYGFRSTWNKQGNTITLELDIV